MINILPILSGIISSVPEAIALWKKIEPFIEMKASTPQGMQDSIHTDSAAVHSLVDDAHTAIAALIEAHASPSQ